ncbi:MAG: hypothetical protein ACJ79E_19010 [Anaeromyxobacteraceae bacterium]
MAAAAHLAQVLGSRAGAISTAVIDAEYAERPELWTRFGEEGRARALEDAAFHVKFLCTALSMGLPDLFADYLGWLAPLLAHRGIGADVLRRHLELLGDAIEANVDRGAAAAALEVLRHGMAALPAEGRRDA